MNIALAKVQQVLEHENAYCVSSLHLNCFLVKVSNLSTCHVIYRYIYTDSRIIGEAFVTYDLKEYYSALYEILFESTFHYMIEHKPNPDVASESDMLIRGLELMFVKKRQIPIDRMAAFIKRFCIVALNMPTKTVGNCMQLVKRLISVSSDNQRLKAMAND